MYIPTTLPATWPPDMVGALSICVRETLYTFTPLVNICDQSE